MSRLKPLMLLVAIVLGGISMACSMLFWHAIPTEALHQQLAAVLALALELCKLAFIPLAGLLWYQGGVAQRFGSAVFMLLGLVLIGVSMWATVAFINASVSQQQQLQRHGDISYLAAEQKLKRLQQQSELRNNLATKGLDFEMITKGGEQADAMLQLELQLDATVKTLQATSAQQAVLPGLPGLNQQWAWILLAALVEACTVAVCCWLSTSLVVANDIADDVASNIATGEALATTPATDVKDDAMKTIDHKHNQKVISLAEAIKAGKLDLPAGELGPKLLTTKIMQLTKSRQPVVRDAISVLVDNGFAKLNGRYYELLK